MKYAILSDVHANLQALEAVLKDARRMGAESFVSLGDAVGYGPLPAEALARVRETCAVALAGNHDDAVSGRIAPKDFIELAADAVERHRETLDADALSWLKSLPHVAEIEGAVCAHGDLVDPPKFYYVRDEADAAANFNACDFALAFVGHTHVPGIFLTGQSGTFYRIEPQDFALEDGKRYIVNVGSVGYPREHGGICRSSYVLYDSAARTVEFRFIPFSVSSVLQRGRGPRARWKLLSALGAVALLAIAACIWLIARPKVEQITVAAPKDDPRCVLTNKTLYVSSATKDLRANLQLVRGTGPANLRIRFFDVSHKVIPQTDQTITIEKSIKRNLIDRNHPIPAEARAVALTVLKPEAKSSAKIERFAPIARSPGEATSPSLR